LSGALGASSLSGTPAWATCSAVAFWPGVTGKFCAWALSRTARPPGPRRHAAQGAACAQGLRHHLLFPVVLHCLGPWAGLVPLDGGDGQKSS
jgi:hypothetical protein